MPAPDFAGTERLIHDLERQQRASHERVREILREEGREDLVAEFDANMRDVETGIYRARNLWHSISPAQRAVLAHFPLTSGNRLRRAHSGYVVDGPGLPLPRPVRLSTLRAMADRGLVDWDGGAFDPEAAAVLSEQGRFVLAKGRPAPDTKNPPQG